MNPLLLLSTSLGLGTLSGVNLYLATCLTGAAIHWDLFHVQDQLQALHVLGSPWIIGVSGALFCVEVVVDKIPGLDSVWDTIHTGVRPLGAIALGLSSLGSVSTEWSVIAALLAGTASATTHAAKMGSRLVTNASPEPVSNFVLSATEDCAVLTGGILLLKYPYATAGACLVLLIGLWILIPRIFKRIGGTFTALKARLSRKTVKAKAV
jgi:hypothetical protein